VDCAGSGVGGRGIVVVTPAAAGSPAPTPAALTAQLSLLYDRTGDALASLASLGDAARDVLEQCLSAPCTERPMRLDSADALRARNARCRRSRQRERHPHPGGTADELGEGRQQRDRERWRCEEAPAAGGVEVLELACCVMVK
jgi:hypothetical protein